MHLRISPQENAGIAGKLPVDDTPVSAHGQHPVNVAGEAIDAKINGLY